MTAALIVLWVTYLLSGTWHADPLDTFDTAAECRQAAVRFHEPDGLSKIMKDDPTVTHLTVLCLPAGMRPEPGLLEHSRDK